MDLIVWTTLILAVVAVKCWAVYTVVFYITKYLTIGVLTAKNNPTK